ncbi:Spore germination protein B3 [Paenibacillus solanacearum]|uniref:Spore germination protein B3 n=1 Tax=Paenibacillus solanacearum TaxID=2048548 RepID=A0A916JZU5_9BACL|nr:Ger(x)C family spore germination protein [Paenibacillus solanacearum]CAG7613675.1 Spore germination protein B3 [Paenibacillus solanacearum]
MRPRLTIAFCSIMLFILSGCGDKAELTEFGFVQAVAVDLTDKGTIALTTHFYNPTGGGETNVAVKQGQRGLNIRTEGDTTFEAVRDIPIHLGRKAKWDHMRIILIGEAIARSQSLGEVLDYFSRDHEPRATVLVLLTKGSAAGYLHVAPFIEYTIGQQLREIEDSGSRYSAKTTKIPLLDLAIQLRSEAGVAALPYVYSQNAEKKILSVAGIALLKDGKLSGNILTPSNTQYWLMLTDRYKSGVIEFPCGDDTKKNGKESLEVMSLKTIVKPVILNDTLEIRVRTKIKGSVSELQCSSLDTKEETDRFEDHIKKTVERGMRNMIAVLQKRQLDALGIGDQIYRKNPQLWRRWKPDWGERFAQSRFVIELEVNVLNTGMTVGNPFSK